MTKQIDLDDVSRGWHWRGIKRPAFATPPAAGEVSVWDFPRPPALLSDLREVVIRWGSRPVARTMRAICVLETSHPPSFYLPLNDVSRQLLVPEPGGSFCEWKGAACYWSLVDGDTRLSNVAWSYPHPSPGYETIANMIAFYSAPLHCSVGGEPVTAQPGGFYGGWITPGLVGPFKGAAGSAAW